MATPVRKIIIQNRVEGQKQIEKLAKQYGRLNKSVKRSADTLDSFKNAFRFAAASFGLREIVQAADQFQLLRDRIKVFVGTGEEADRVFGDLAKAARFTKTSINSLAQSYNRVALATQELGLNSDQILATTVALQQTFRLSGATIAEATAATIQLSQGLSSGQLRGQELRSVLEQNAVFANLLSKELGVTRGQLIKFAESGKITSDVVLNALSKNFDSLNEQANQLGTTINQSVTIALDALRLKIAQFNQQFNISGGIEKFFEIVIDSLDSLIATAGILLAQGVLVKVAAQFSILYGVLTGATAITAGGVIGGIVVGLGALAIAFNEAGKAQDRFVKSKPITERIENTQTALDNLVKSRQRLLKTKRGQGFVDQVVEDLTGFNANKDNLRKNLAGIRNLERELERLEELQSKGLKFEKQSGSGNDLIDRFSKAFKKLKLEAQSLNRGPLTELNQKFKNNQITIEEYSSSVASIRLEELNKKFEEGKIDVDQYGKSLIQLSVDLNNINPIALGAVTGLEKVADSASNLAQQIQNGFVKAFKTIEDELLNFTKTGTFNFQKFAQVVVDEITRIVIRTQIIAPAARAIGFALSGGGGAGGGGVLAQGLLNNANGNAFEGGRVTAFANGGVVSGPTLFPMANGTGLMGEAGPEAILPLTRRGGKLGVEGSGTVVNVINQAGGEVETSERQGLFFVCYSECI